MKTHLFNGDCLEVMSGEEFQKIIEGKNVIIVTDPPFNIGYHYKSYKDNMKEDEYLEFITQVLTCTTDKFAVIHYPEKLHKLSIKLQKSPERLVSWVYNSNTPRQHRNIAFYGVKPNFNLVKQPYKNLNDKRIQKRIAEGKTGAKIYDWWNVNQVKNVSKAKISHPCKMPQKVVDNIIGILPKENLLVVDPFMGTGTTGVACIKYGVEFVGIELEKEYFEDAKKNIEEQANKKNEQSKMEVEENGTTSNVRKNNNR